MAILTLEFINTQNCRKENKQTGHAQWNRHYLQLITN